MSRVYYAITIWQPWASLIAAGLKTWEFRSWAAPNELHNQVIAIHAGARLMKRAEIAGLIYKLQHAEQWRETGISVGKRADAIRMLEQVQGLPSGLPLGRVICTVRLGRPVYGSEVARLLGLPVANDSDRMSMWGWPLSDPKMMNCIAQGKPGGFWQVQI